MKADRYEFRPLHMSRSGRIQSASVYEIATNSYVGREWTFFPSVFSTDEIKSSYWTNGHAETIGDGIEMLRSLGLDPGKYHWEEEPYGPGVFPACTEYDDLIAFYDASQKAQGVQA